MFSAKAAVNEKCKRKNVKTAQLTLAFYIPIAYISDMKNLILISFLVPAMAMAQSKDDYEKAMNRFKQYYNQQNSKKIVGLFSPEAQQFVEDAFGKKKVEELINKYGKILSFKYIGVTKEDGVAIFRTEFEKQTFTTGFILEEGNKFGTFRFNTTSDEIEAMLRNSG
ncbi:MAG: hypothetical protein K0R82_1285 [Flavipsychrobacter sp.]|nr:hypothetical protein [Flavipsychrobacter sp.]